jgi:arylformamidase
MYFDCSPPLLKTIAPVKQGAPSTPTSGTETVIAGETSVLNLCGISESMEDVLETLIGPVRVIELSGDDLDEQGALRDHVFFPLDGPPPPRVILKMGRVLQQGRNPWLSAVLAGRCAEDGFQLVGIDANQQDWPGCDRFMSLLTERGILSLRGLKLDTVPAGDYVLIALPMPVCGSTVVPARVILKAIM